MGDAQNNIVSLEMCFEALKVQNTEVIEIKLKKYVKDRMIL